MSLRVLSIDASAAVHGAPFVGVRKFGVPPGGPFDRFSAACANALVGNPPDADVLEIGGFGATFEVLEPMSIGLMGPEIEVTGIRGLGRWRLEPGARITISRLVSGARLYLAMPGGVFGPPAPGPLSVRPIRAGDHLAPGSNSDLNSLHAASVVRPSPMLTYVPADPADPIHARLSATHLKVGLNSNRVGVRLAGFPETHHHERLSEPVAPGVLQWTPSGELIALGPDGPTVGGYPKLGFLVDSALDTLGQARPGDAVRLSPIRFEDALALAGKITETRAPVWDALRP